MKFINNKAYQKLFFKTNTFFSSYNIADFPYNNEEPNSNKALSIEKAYLFIIKLNR